MRRLTVTFCRPEFRMKLVSGVRPLVVAAWSIAAAVSTLAPSASAAAPQQAQTRLQINLREAPDLASPIVAVMPQGGTLEVLQWQGEFVRVRRADGVEGYLKHKYLVGATPPVANAAAPAAAEPAVPSTAAAPAPAPALAAAPAPAPPAARPSAATPARWTMQVSAGSFFSGRSDGKVSADLAQDVPGASIRDLDQQMPYANVRFSYWVAPSFGVELGYLILKPLDFSLQADDPERDVEALKDSLDRNLPVTGPGITLALKTQKAWDRWRIEGRAGAWFGLRNDVSFFVDDDKVRQADERVAGLLGVSGHYRLHPHWDLGLELTGMHADHTVGGAGLVLTFTP